MHQNELETIIDNYDPIKAVWINIIDLIIIALNKYLHDVMNVGTATVKYFYSSTLLHILYKVYYI